MAFAIKDRTETVSEINVTPLVDVTLVLLIIFMVTAPMLSASVEVDLQRSTSAVRPSAKEHLVVTIAADRRIYVASSVVPELEVLPARVKAELARTGIESVAIRGDRSVEYGYVLQVIDRLRSAEIKNVGLVMAPPAERPEGRR